MIVVCNMKSLGTLATAARFMKKVDTNGPEVRAGLGPCWLWRGGRAPNGYGRYRRLTVDGKRRVLGAHVEAWELVHGPVPKGLFVCHECDVKHCVIHLYLGTNQTNQLDARERGRLRPPSGETHPHAKLTEEDVLMIRGFAPLGWTQHELAEAFGVQVPCISRVLSGKRRVSP